MIPGILIERLLLKDSFQVDVRSAQNINSPKNPRAVPQSVARINVPHKANIIVSDIKIFDNLDVRKFFVEMGCYRHPKMMLLQTKPKMIFWINIGSLKYFLWSMLKKHF